MQLVWPQEVVVSNPYREVIVSTIVVVKAVCGGGKKPYKCG